ncbi:MAG: amidohydrolase family protein [Bacteroidia bacterium]|nr:amidohydrolase family protein [Bacteroidia bacterium]
MLLCGLSLSAVAQRPVPAGGAGKKILLMGATAHIGNGQVIEMSAIGIDHDKLSFVMDAKGYKPDPRAFDTIIYVNGRQAYPGFIAMNTNLGLSDLELVRATNDFRESGSINPSARALIAYNADSRVIPTVRDNGILLAQVAPQGGLLSGTSSLMQLDAWNWEDAAVKADEGLWLNWPSMRIVKASWADPEEEQKERNDKAMQNLIRQFDEARAYARGNPAIKNRHLEAMKGLFDGSQILYIRCNYAREIVEAVNFAGRYNIRIAIAGGSDSWRVSSLLKEKNIPVIITRTHALPYREDEDVDLPYKLPFLLRKAGVQCAIADDGFWQQRNLGFQAGTAAAYGLSKEEALESITLIPARIMGVEKTCGSLEDGKDATLFISSGDALDMTGCSVEMAFVQGRMIDLDNYQKELYRRYVDKYQLEKK